MSNESLRSRLPEFTIREMLEAGVHYGHKKNRWNPQMSSFIYGSKGDLHIIDLTKTYSFLLKALEAVHIVAKNNGRILFVGTKKQSSVTIAEYAKKCKQHFVNHRWLGGMITNWSTVADSITTLNKIEKELLNPESNLTKKEKLRLDKKREKLERSLGGIRELNGAPALVIVFDTIKESIAIQEADKLKIPVVAIVDTNSSLDGIIHPIPGNDDSAKATAFFCNLFAETITKARTEDAKYSKASLSEEFVAVESIAVIEKNAKKPLKVSAKKTVTIDSKEDVSSHKKHVASSSVTKLE